MYKKKAFGLKIKIQNLSIGPILTTLYLENGKSYAKSVGILIQNFFKGIKKKIALKIKIQWNLSNSIHQRTKKMCRIVQDLGILRFYFS